MRVPGNARVPGIEAAWVVPHGVNLAASVHALERASSKPVNRTVRSAIEAPVDDAHADRAEYPQTHASPITRLNGSRGILEVPVWASAERRHRMTIGRLGAPAPNGIYSQRQFEAGR